MGRGRCRPRSRQGLLPTEATSRPASLVLARLVRIGQGFEFGRWVGKWLTCWLRPPLYNHGGYFESDRHPRSVITGATLGLPRNGGVILWVALYMERNRPQPRWRAGARPCPYRAREGGLEAPCQGSGPAELARNGTNDRTRQRQCPPYRSMTGIVGID